MRSERAVEIVGLLHQLPTVGAVELAIVGVSAPVRVDEVGIDRAPAPIAEERGGIPPQSKGRYALQLAQKQKEPIKIVDCARGLPNGYEA